MKIEHINPFIEATVNTFKTMCGVIPARDGKLQLKEGGFRNAYELIGVIGLASGIKGAVLMTMNIDVGLKMISAFLQEEIKEPNSDLMDGFGEILNIIVGDAAARLEGYKLTFSIPTVTVGESQKVHSKQSSPWIIIPMKVEEWGKFNIEVSMEEE